MPNASIKELYADKDHLTLTMGPLGVVIWRADCTLKAVFRVKEIGEAALAAGSTALVMGIVEESATIPSAEARRLSAEVNDQLNERGVIAFGAIFPEHGFSGAWKRGVITGMSLLARRRYPFKVFQQPLDACTWFRELSGAPNLDWVQAASAIDRARQEYAARYGAQSECARSATSMNS